ncbi:Hypothetical protein R9X50_00335300 [Acrodontium crateriforme]|uniref:Uncharacterized protein n=1 Tax=Acrodontium crateriforme TaxID=150365 RepID=A0AAQ3R7D1_9PEZI|nr:Hypothetical protein R9X50_00335300 [Acrodontium crateriforme]
MQSTILLVIWGAVAYGIFQIASRIIANRRHAEKAKEWKCQEPPHYPDCGFLGLKHLKYMQDADKKRLFPDMMVDRQRFMSELHGRECSTFTFSVLGQKMLFTSDPKNIQAMLATKFDDFGVGESRRGNMTVSIGDGIFVQDGKAWEHSRGLLRPNFVRDQVSDLDMEERHMKNLLKVLKTDSEGWTAITDIQTLFFRFTIDSATDFLFGDSVESQLAEADDVSLRPQNDRETSDEKSFSFNFDAAQRHLAARFRLGDMYWMHNPKDFKENNKIINDFIKRYVNIALKKRSEEKKVEEGHGDKKHYVFVEAIAEQTQDPEEIRGQLLNILLAGRDTTASLLSWLFHELLRHPEVFEKLRSTIIEEFGTFENPRNISFASLKGCQYLQNTLSETLRVWTTVPGNGRRTNKDTMLPRGGGPDGESPVYLRAQSDALYSTHVMHRRKDLWGEDADQFKPERFQGRRPGWEFLPFNGGPRICIGQQFALTEAAYVIVRLLQRFDRIDATGQEVEEVVTSNLTLTSAPGKNVHLRFHAAKE